MLIKNPRQIRFNKKTDTGDQALWKYQHTFFILNTTEQIKIIQGKILEALSQCDELEELESGILIPTKSLHGKLITLKSNTTEIKDRSRVYNTEAWHYDRTLKPMNDVQFDIYCDKFR